MEDVPQRDDRASRAVPESGNDESESDIGIMIYDLDMPAICLQNKFMALKKGIKN